MEDEENGFVFRGGGLVFDVFLVCLGGGDVGVSCIEGRRGGKGRPYACRGAQGGGGRSRVCRHRGRCQNLGVCMSVCLELVERGDLPAAIEK